MLTVFLVFAVNSSTSAKTKSNQSNKQVVIIQKQSSSSMNLILIKYLILSLVLCLIITSSHSKCLQSFLCRIQNFNCSFPPITDSRNPECGFFMIEGCNQSLPHHENPRIRLAPGGRSYDLLDVSTTCKNFIIQVHVLENLEFEEKISGFLINEFLPTSLRFVSFSSPNVTLKWDVSEDFHKSEDKLYCKKGRTSPLMLIVILALSGGGLLLLILLCLLLFYIIRLRRKIIDSRSFQSRNISFGPSKSDIDGGSSFFGIPIFSYTELEAATDNFDPSKELGDGGFGTVYYGKLRDGREVAIKRLYEQNCRRVEQFLNEIKIITSLRHPSLVTLYGCTSRRSRELLLVYEYIPNGTVADHLHGGRAKEAPLTWPIRMRIAIETATAMAYLHKSDIIHRDVKTDNILLDKDYNVKVADFGLSRLFPSNATHISTVPGGTPGYIDPEYHQCYQVTDKSDVYSFGVVLIELISSMPAVDINRQTHEINLANLAVNRIQRCAFDELIDPSLGYNIDAEVTRMTTSVAEIAFLCLQLGKDMRPSMGDVLAFLKDI